MKLNYNLFIRQDLVKKKLIDIGFPQWFSKDDQKFSYGRFQGYWMIEGDPRQSTFKTKLYQGRSLHKSTNP